MLTTGSFVDEKDYTVNTVEKNSADTRMLFSDKMKNSTARVITWSTSPGLMFEHIGFFLAVVRKSTLLSHGEKRK